MAPTKYVRVPDGGSLTLTFNPSAPKEVDGKFGIEYHYVTDLGTFVATKYLADQVNATLDTSNTATLTINRHKVNNRTRYDIEPVTGASRSANPVPTTVQRAVMPPSPTADPRTFFTLVQDFHACMVQAVGLCDAVFSEGKYTTEDVRAIAASLYIEANRSGIPIPKVGQPELDLENTDDGSFDEDVPF